MKLTVIEKILIVATTVMLISVFNNKYSSPPDNKPPQVKQVESPKVTDLGLTVSEFRLAYEELVAAYSVNSARISETYAKGETIFFYLNNSVAITLETEGTNTEIKKITVSCEPDKFRNERSIIERATIAYSIVIEILAPELTADERLKILKEMTLSSKIKHASVSKGDITYKTRLYNGILMLSAEPN